MSRVDCAAFNSLIITSARAASALRVIWRRLERMALDAWMRAMANSRDFIARSALAFSDLKVDSARRASFLRRFEWSYISNSRVSIYSFVHFIR